MKPTRREFLGSVSIAALAGALPDRVAAKSAPLGGTRPSLRVSGDDPLGVRADFPVLEESIYLDGAYITPSPRSAIESATRFVEANATKPVSVGEMLGQTTAARAKFARLIGAHESDVGVLSATSDGENIVTAALELGAGDNVVVDDLHYETTYILYERIARETGLEIRVAESREGAAPVDIYEPLVDARTRLISVAWISHQNGYRHDLSALAELAHAYDAYLYADAIQGIGALELDVEQTGVDFLAAGTYKWLLAGYGIAPFYVRPSLRDRVEPDRWGWGQMSEELGPRDYRLHSDGRKYMHATPAFASAYQLSASLEYLEQVGVDRIEAHTVDLAGRLRDALDERGFRVWTPPGNASQIVTFEPGVAVERVRDDLENAGVRVSLKAGGRQIRVGIALFNNSDDIDALLAVTEGWA